MGNGEAISVACAGLDAELGPGGWEKDGEQGREWDREMGFDVWVMYVTYRDIKQSYISPPAALDPGKTTDTQTPPPHPLQPLSSALLLPPASSSKSPPSPCSSSLLPSPLSTPAHRSSPSASSILSASIPLYRGGAVRPLYSVAGEKGSGLAVVVVGWGWNWCGERRARRTRW